MPMVKEDHCAVIQNDETKFIVANAYFPNDQKQGIAFAKQMYSKVLELQTEYPEHVIFCAGDMNICLSSNENFMSDFIRNNNKVAELSDAYRSVHA